VLKVRPSLCDSGDRKSIHVLLPRTLTASKTNGGTVDVSLAEYINERRKDSTWPTLGFNILGFND